MATLQAESVLTTRTLSFFLPEIGDSELKYFDPAQHE